MVNKILPKLKYLAILAIAVALVWWQLSAMTAEQMARFKIALLSTNYLIVVPILLLNLLSQWVRGARWRLLIEPLGHAPKSSNLFAAVLACNMINAAVPRAGEIVKCTMVSRKEKLPIDKIFGTILIERAFDMFCYGVLILATLLVEAGVVKDYIKEKLGNFSGQAAGAIVLKISIALVLFLSLLYLIKFLVRKYPHIGIFEKIKNAISGVMHGFAAVRHMQRKGLFILLTVLMWGLYWVQIYIGFSAMQGLQHLGVSESFSVLVLTTLAMIVMPGGLGAFPIFVMEALSLYGIDSALGNAFGWLMWGVSTILTLLAGAIAMVAFSLMKGTNANDKPTPEEV